MIINSIIVTTNSQAIIIKYTWLTKDGTLLTSLDKIIVLLVFANLLNESMYCSAKCKDAASRPSCKEKD